MFVKGGIVSKENSHQSSIYFTTESNLSVVAVNQLRFIPKTVGFDEDNKVIPILFEDRLHHCPGNTVHI